MPFVFTKFMYLDECSVCDRQLYIIKMLKKKSTVEIGGRKYVLKDQIGMGGSGTVWLAESNGAEFAIKFIKSDSKSKIQRFENEIAFCKHPNHKNIVSVISEGRIDNMPCYVMLHYPNTLRDVINEEKDPDVLIKYLLKICSAVKYIHSKKIIHRDIKPENILINGRDLVLADFGISHFKAYGITRESELLANRNYVAPEQKLKNNATKVSVAADVYALGLIINECFTKHNPAGSQFKLIADYYPLLSELDVLIGNMIRQNDEDRLSIEAVCAELKFIYSKFKDSLQSVNAFLREQDFPDSINKSVYHKVLKIATEDILIGKYLFYTSTYDDLKRYNHNWHMKIGYTVDDFLFNLYVQEQLFSLCKSKFEYEANVYRSNNWHHTLNLQSNQDHIALYKRMAAVLEKYKFAHRDESLFDLSGATLKYFSCCADYHCKEILERIDDTERRAEENLKNAPIIWIVERLHYGIRENLQYLYDGINGLAGKYEFNFTAHILINWERSANYLTNDDDDFFFDKSYLEQEEQERMLLTIAAQKWNIKSQILNADYCSLKFHSYRQYQKFRQHALQLAKPHYIFEGDVLEMFSNPSFIGSMVELKLSRVFGLGHTLATILGLKAI